MELAEHTEQVTEVVAIAEPETGGAERGKGKRRTVPLAFLHDGEATRVAERDAPRASVSAPVPVPAPDEKTDQEAAHDTSSESTQPAPARVVRKTKTLADVTMPARVAAPRPDDSLARAPAALTGANGEAERQAEQHASDAERGEASSMPAAQTEAESPRVTTGQIAAMRARGRLSSATRPIPAVGPLALGGARGSVSEREQLAQGEEALADPTASRFLWAVRRGDARMVLRAALAHVLAGLVAGVAASALLLAGSDLGYWLLGLAGVTIPCGVVAYALPQWKRAARPAALVLVGAQVAALGWACALVGPQVALLLLVPAAAWLALRLGGRRALLLCGVGNVVVYGAFLVVTGDGTYVPALTLDAAGGTTLDVGAALVGMGLLLAGLLQTADARERSEAAARARLYELRLLRAEMARTREQVERDGYVLEQALTAALRGRGIDPVTAEGALSPLAEGVNAVAERMATLQKDREDRLRLEAALRTLVRAVERGWLGLPWIWPEASGTMLDDLVALLRTPRPQEQRSAARRNDELPTFVTLPTAETTSRPTGPHSHPGASYPSPGASHASAPLPTQGWDDLLSR